MNPEYFELKKDELSRQGVNGTTLNNFTERSELAQEIISGKSDFFERWSLSVFLVLLLLLMAGTWFVKFPDIVRARAILKGSIVPKEIKVNQTGRLTGPFVKNNQSVKYGEILGWIESGADAKEIPIQAPVEGTVVLATPLEQKQYIEQGTQLGYVNPSDTRFYVQVSLEQANLGKVETGMKVQLRFDAYPYQEAGFISGTLTFISGVAVDSVYFGFVQLDNGLVTSQNKTIQYRPGLKAQALIVTKQMRLLERLYYSITRAVSVNK